MTTHRRRQNPASPARNPSLGGFLFDLGKDAVVGGVNSLMRDAVKAGETKVKNTLMSGARGVMTRGVGALGGQAQTYAGWPDWFKQRLMREGNIVAIIGARDTGKSTAAVVISELVQRQRPGARIYFPGYPQDYAPSHIIAIPERAIPDMMSMVAYGDIVILDDAYRWFNAMRTGSRVGLLFQDWVNSVAHSGVTIIITVQASSDLNKAGLRADVFAFKPPERMFEGTERPQMRPIVKMAQQYFDKIPMSEWVRHLFIYADPDHAGGITYDRPAWMTRSKAKYRGGRRLSAQDNFTLTAGAENERASLTPANLPGVGQGYYNPFDSDR